MNWIWTIALVLVLLVAVILAVGASLPREHVAERTQHIKAAPAVVFARIADLPNRTQWVTGPNVEVTTPSRLVTRIADDSLEFGGTWTISVAPAAIVSRFLIGHTRTMDQFLKDLAAQYP